VENLVVERLSHEDAEERGNAARERVPFEALGTWDVSLNRPDPVSLLEAQEATRVPWLLPLRHGRMAISAFTFYRGAARVMASDLSSQRHTGLTAQICGDAHLLNFGLYGTPERRLVFDVNDFDETLPGPWEWDLKRLVASAVIAARGMGLKKGDQKAAARRAGRVYREAMADFAKLSALSVFYASLSEDDLLATSGAGLRKRVQKNLSKAKSRTNEQVETRLTEIVDGQRRIKTEPPTLYGFDDIPPGTTALESVEQAHDVLRAYRRSLGADRRRLLERYRVADIALKVVGVGSVGTRCFVTLLEGPEGDPLFLQVKQADASVFEPHLRKSRFRNHGQRVVEGQRLMQAASDIFLGWVPGLQGSDFYWRQLKDWKGSVDLAFFDSKVLERYVGICAWTLARAHARSGEPREIAAYCGDTDEFERAVARWAVTYADQNEVDYEEFLAAIEGGRLDAEKG
jgi:uncharacterized protein (DUF2252 family)